jgi:hypothetical protein
VSVVYDVAQTDASGENYTRVLMRSVEDCTTRQSGSLDVITYGSDGSVAKQASVPADLLRYTMRDVAPGTLGETVHDAVCSKEKS